METIILVFQILSCLFLIGLILIQKGRGADIGAAFGGASNTVFGSRGPATILNKITIVVAVVFLGSSIFLAHSAKNRSAASVIDQGMKMEQKINQEEGVVPETTTRAEEVKAEEKGVGAEETQQEVDKNTKE